MTDEPIDNTIPPTEPVHPDPANPDSAHPDPVNPNPTTAAPLPTPPKNPSRRAAFGAAFRRVFGDSPQLTVGQQIQRRTLVSFSVFALLGVGAWKAWFLIKDAAQQDGVQAPLRKGLDLDDEIFRHTLSPTHLAKTYPKSAAATRVRTNSLIGLGKGLDPSNWQLKVTTADNDQLGISLDQLRALPKTEIVFEFKCIEGWSQVSWWGGVRFADFIQHYGLTKEASRAYVGLSTPDDLYYVGIDTPSALHPQTLLCYEMNGQPLPPPHGAPLRLIIPIKYGVKNLKGIGKIFFSDDRPKDYWFERGYDYYCGL